jgi:hypothetical protein
MPATADRLPGLNLDARSPMKTDAGAFLFTLCVPLINLGRAPAAPARPSPGRRPGASARPAPRRLSRPPTPGRPAKVAQKWCAQPPGIRFPGRAVIHRNAEHSPPAVSLKPPTHPLRCCLEGRTEPPSPGGYPALCRHASRTTQTGGGGISLFARPRDTFGGNTLGTGYYPQRHPISLVACIYIVNNIDREIRARAVRYPQPPMSHLAGAVRNLPVSGRPSRPHHSDEWGRQAHTTPKLAGMHTGTGIAESDWMHRCVALALLGSLSTPLCAALVEDSFDSITAPSARSSSFGGRPSAVEMLIGVQGRTPGVASADRRISNDYPLLISGGGNLVDSGLPTRGAYSQPFTAALGSRSAVGSGLFGSAAIPAPATFGAAFNQNAVPTSNYSDAKAAEADPDAEQATTRAPVRRTPTLQVNTGQSWVADFMEWMKDNRAIIIAFGLMSLAFVGLLSMAGTAGRGQR